MPELHRVALIVAAMAISPALQLPHAFAQWWSHAPGDFEECADQAAKAADKGDRTRALSVCNAKFAGRRKPGGGYTYYDFLQDRSFDIAGPNPTPQEQKYFDQQYALFLERQRRGTTATDDAKQQDEGQLKALLQPQTEKVPIPHPRPGRLRARGPVE